jgi:acyl-CoA synthetase (AMP-forming)/AMP-acid ligase II
MFELVDDDVAGVTLPVFAQRARSMAEVLERGASSYADRPYLVGPDRTIAFADAPAVAARVAHALVEEHGIAVGDRVALAGRFSVDHAMAVWGATHAGAVVATMNPAWTAAELATATALVTPSLLVVDDDVAERLDDRAGLGIDVPVIRFADLARAAAEVVGVVSPPAEVDEDDPFTIIFTSGTTGTPKGATLSHRNAIQFSMAAAATSAVHSIVHEIPRGSGVPAVIAASPLFHISGLLGQLTNSACWGTTLVVAPPGRWDETVHLELTERHRVTSWSIVPTQLWRLIDHPELDRYDLSSLEMVGGGGATFPPELLRRTAERLPGIALALRVGYGMTETAGSATLLQPPIDPDRLATVGTPVAGAEVQIVGPDGRPVADGEIGEIAIRSAQVFLGYWGDEAATAAVVDADRWYRTGDFGRLDGEYLTLESRLRDLIIRGGENIYPIEVENRLIEHPDIDDAAVLGVDHPTLGQEVRAVIVVRDGASVSPDDVRDWVGAALARFKVPTVVDVVDALPRNETGKVLKAQLAG